MRYNTLQITNQILNALDLDAVSTIGETEESEQVVVLLRRSTTELDLDMNWAQKKTVVRPSTSTESGFVVGTTDWKNLYPAIPWAMALPSNVEEVNAVYYNERDILYVPPIEFLAKIESGGFFLDTGDPRYWTIGLFDQDYLLFDSFEADDEDHLTSANSELWVTQHPTQAIAADTDEIDLSDKFYKSLISLCLARGFYEIIGNIELGDRYWREHMTAKHKLFRQNKKAKMTYPVLGDINFARRSHGGNAIDSSMINDVSVI